MTNIMDGMYETKFISPSPTNKQTQKKRVEKEEKEMPMVLKNLKNGS